MPKTKVERDIAPDDEVNAADATLSQKGSVADPVVEVKSRQRRRGCRGWLTILLLLFSCLACVAVILAATWASGHLKRAVCDVVLSESQLHRQLDCQNSPGESQGRIENPDDEFPIRVADPDELPSNSGVDVAAIFEQTSPSVVGIGIKNNEISTDQVIGSGFVISANGLVATNQHVVSYSQAEYFVKFEGSDELIDVEEVYRDPVNDIAILKVAKAGLPALVLGDSEVVKPGQHVVAIGNPLGELSSTVTSGIISGINREVSVGQSFLRTSVTRFEGVIQTDAAINPGNSGGPLLNSLGQVIGINFATVQGYDNLSFAIPVSTLRTRLAELQRDGGFKIPYLGIGYRMRLVDVGSEVFIGAEITNVESSGTAASVLRRNDIILQFDGQQLDQESLASLIQKSEVGETVDMIILRDGKRQTVSIKIGER